MMEITLVLTFFGLLIFSITMSALTQAELMEIDENIYEEEKDTFITKVAEKLKLIK